MDSSWAARARKAVWASVTRPDRHPYFVAFGSTLHWKTSLGIFVCHALRRQHAEASLALTGMVAQHFTGSLEGGGRWGSLH
jgi:hypothetical protein